jgi:KUP system potassium uptake protein
MLLWFVTIGLLGLSGVLGHPAVIVGIDPRQAVWFLGAHGWHGFVVLGGVFLAITGGEALYADMGHFGRKPIRSAWFYLVLPTLLLSYAGQTALLIDNPALSGNPFFALAPSWAIVPLVVLATLATIIASQAIITGAFSLTRQAMQLGWLPGLNIRQTSADVYGQIYVPFVNWSMMLGTLALAYGFGSSDRLAGAYGTAVSTTMLLTTGLLFYAMRDLWRWPVAVAVAASAVFLTVDAGFFAACLLKLLDGGWIPLVFGALIFLVMRTWHTGTVALRRRLIEGEKGPESFWTALRTGHIPRVPGTAVFLSRSGGAIPSLMIRHIAQMKALQETAITLTVRFAEIPRVPPAERTVAEHMSDGMHVTAQFGFVEVPNLPAALAHAQDQGCPFDLEDAVYFATRDAVVRSEHHPRLMAWQRMLFAFMYRNAVHAADRFDLPVDRYLEIGRQVRL